LEKVARTSPKRMDRSIAQLRISDTVKKKPSFQSQPLKVQPVIAHQSTLWAALGEQDTPIVKNKISNAKTTGVIPVIGSEATLWAPLGLSN